jgi:phospholipase/carboxylesterase
MLKAHFQKAIAVLSALLALAVCAPGVAFAQSGSTTGVIAARVSAPSSPSSASGYQRVRGKTSATLYVPESYSPEKPAPLALLLHGAGGKGDDMLRRFRAEADARGIILLAPDSAARTWDIAMSFDRQGARAETPEFGADVARIDDALAQVFSHYAINASRVAIIGFSDGAAYSLSLGARNSSLFRNIIAIAPGMLVPGATQAPSRVFIAHGRKDRVIPFDLSDKGFAPALRQAGFEVEFVPFDGGHELEPAIISQALDWFLKPAN